MAKRFIDTSMFDDPWFMDLTKDGKIAWMYILTKCDHAGIIQINERLFKVMTGINSFQTVREEIGNRLIQLRESYFFIPKFIFYQYPGFPKSNVNAQAGAIKRLKEFGLFDEENLTLHQQFMNSSPTLNQELNNSYGYGYGYGYGYDKGGMGGKMTDSYNSEINVSFDEFWELYDKKVGPLSKIKRKWENLTDDERLFAMEHIQKYKEAVKEKQFRKNPDTYLNQKSWNDEIIQRNGTPVKNLSKSDRTKQLVSEAAEDLTRRIVQNQANSR